MGKKKGQRYVQDIELGIDQNFVIATMQEYIAMHGFKPVIEGTENYYKSGDGFWTAIHGMKYWYNNGWLHFEAWIGKIGKEMNPGDGSFYGSAAKKPYYDEILMLLHVFEDAKWKMQQGIPYMTQTVVQPGQPYQPAQPYQADVQGNYVQPGYVQPNTIIQNGPSSFGAEMMKSKNKSAVIAFVLSFISLILSFFTAYSFIIYVAVYTLAIKDGLKSEKKGLAIAAIVINSASIVIMILMVFVFAIFAS